MSADKVRLLIKEEVEIYGRKFSPGDVVLVPVDKGRELLRDGKVHIAEANSSNGPIGLEKR